MNDFEVANWLNYDEADASHYEHPTGVSITVPDMTLSIAELIEKHTINNNIPVSVRQPQYLGDDPVPDPDRMDMADRQEYAEQLGIQAEEFRQDISAKQKLRKEKEAIAEQKRIEREKLIDELDKKNKGDANPPKG